MPTLTVSGSASTGSGYQFGDLIEKVYRRVMSGVQEITCTLGANYTLDGTTFNGIPFTGSGTTAISTGTILSVDLELMLVTSYNSSSNTASVERGYLGSVATTHYGPTASSAGTPVYVNPSLTRFDCGVAINDDLNSLSAAGLVRIGSAEITYNPVFVGYDLGDLPANFIDIVEVRAKTPMPQRNYPPITRWKVSRYQDTGVFPSGNSLTIAEGGWPGQPMFVTYTAPLIPFVDQSDDVADTPATNDLNPPYNGYSDTYVPNLPTTAVDIPPMGAIIQLVEQREFQRNNYSSQPDPRKAAEIPAGSIMNSVGRLEIQRQRRIQEEVERIRKQYTRYPKR